ncbi:hypothetical protein KUTeg_008397 [Tegillarca granosa]|uniref:Sodium-dependent glucose transporter 1-like protein n=1 Tax=Tegillarca granosa TaxID=220873 RepID=A0ABQ9F916_TEGGR|nr:hypothetical protein KUTeg_008397 [Tegillarca granosa]
MDTNATNQLNEQEEKFTSEQDQYNGCALGWKVAQIGPSLLDLQIIAKTTLDKISGIFTSDAIGYLGGTFLSGFLFLFTVANAELFRIWKTDNAAIVQALHFFFTIGAALSPTVTAPFLMPSSRDLSNNTKSLSCAEFNETNKMDNCSFLYVNEDKQSHQHRFDNESRLYIAYLITASMYVVPGIFLLFSIFKIDKDFFQRTKSKIKDSDLTGQPSFREKLPILILVASLSITYVVLFFVEQLNWTKTSASYLASLFWATFALGRFVSIFVLKYIKSSHLLGINGALLIVASFGIFISSLYIFNPGLWISVGLCGLSMSSMFPTIFTWTDSELLPVNAFITSLIFASGASTAIINPIILGYLMDNVDKMAFCYFILGGTISFVIVFIIGLFISRKSELKFKKSIEIVVSEEEFLNSNEIESSEQEETHNVKEKESP